MADTIIISALRAKRAELDGEIRQAEKRIARLRLDLEAIDGSIRVFDPSLVPQTIRPKLKRKPSTQFRHGQFGRAIFDTLRTATAPMTLRDIAAKIAADYCVDVSGKGAVQKLISKARNILARKRDGFASEMLGDTLYWRVAAD